VDRAPPS